MTKRLAASLALLLLGCTQGVQAASDTQEYACRRKCLARHHVSTRAWRHGAAADDFDTRWYCYHICVGKGPDGPL